MAVVNQSTSFVPLTEVDYANYEPYGRISREKFNWKYVNVTLYKRKMCFVKGKKNIPVSQLSKYAARSGKKLELIHSLKIDLLGEFVKSVGLKTVSHSEEIKLSSGTVITKNTVEPAVVPAKGKYIYVIVIEHGKGNNIYGVPIGTNIDDAIKDLRKLVLSDFIEPIPFDEEESEEISDFDEEINESEKMDECKLPEQIPINESEKMDVNARTIGKKSIFSRAYSTLVRKLSGETRAKRPLRRSVSVYA